MEVKFEMSGEFFTRGQKAGGEITVGVWAVVRFATQEWDDDMRELITTGDDEVDVLGCWIGCEKIGEDLIGGSAIKPQNINGAFYEAIKSAAIAYAVDKLDGQYIAEQMALTPSAQPA